MKRRKGIVRKVHSHTKLASDLIREWGALDKRLTGGGFADKQGRAALVKRKKRVGSLIAKLEKTL